MKIGYDVDDVLFDWLGTAHTYSTNAGVNRNKIKSVTMWNCHDEYGCTLDEWLAAIYPMAPDGVYLSQPPLPGAVKSVKRVKDAGHEVHLITSRGAFVHGDIIKRDTTAWVEQWFPFVDSLTFSSDKTHPRTDWFLDDLPKNIDKVLVAGIKGVILNRPHNHSVPGYQRVNTVDDYADLVLEETDGPPRRSKTRKLLPV